MFRISILGFRFSRLSTSSSETSINQKRAIMQNKPNLLNSQLNVSQDYTRAYENKCLRRHLQNKPNQTRSEAEIPACCWRGPSLFKFEANRRQEFLLFCYFTFNQILARKLSNYVICDLNIARLFYQQPCLFAGGNTITSMQHRFGIQSEQAIFVRCQL